MCGKFGIGLKKTLVLFLLLLVVLSPSVYSEVILTDEQDKALTQHLESLEKELSSAKEKLNTQKNELIQAKNELNEVKKELTEAQNSLKESKEILNGQKDTLKQLEKSLKQERKEQKKGKIKSFCWGLGTGFAVGTVTGIYTSNKFK